MGFIKICDILAGKVFVGERAVGGIYVGDERVYPNIVGVDTGVDADQWSYTDPTRTRTLHLWEQDVYADGSRGEKRYTGTSTETQTATVTTDWDGTTYWNGACGSNYYYVDYKKVRTKYAYADTARYSDWRNGDSRSRRVDGQCGWVRAWRVSADWANTGSTCNSAGTVGQYNCDGTYTVKYNQQKRTLSYCYPDMSGSTQTKTEYRVGSVASRSLVDGQCGYVFKPTIYLTPGSEETKPNNCTVYASGKVLDDIVVDIDVYDDMNSQIIGSGSVHITAGQTVGTGLMYPMNSWDKPMRISRVNGISTPPAELTNAKYSWPK